MKLKILFITIISGFILTSVSAQKYITKSGRIDIISKSSLYTVEGVNKKVASILNTETGELVISMLIRSFEFDETVMEEQFNGNYMESKSFPKSIFKGKISNFEEINFTTNGNYKTTVTGKLTIHGITNDVQEHGVITIRNGVISAKSEFHISLTDFEIQIESAIKNSIDDDVLLKVDFNFNKL